MKARRLSWFLALVGAAASTGCGARTGLEVRDAGLLDVSVPRDAPSLVDAADASLRDAALRDGDLPGARDTGISDVDRLDAGGPEYLCGVAMVGWDCDNGRRSYTVVAETMAEAIAACRATGLEGYPLFCYVLNRGDPMPGDESDCDAERASWRPGNTCCNFMGTLSCPIVSP